MFEFIFDFRIARWPREENVRAKIIELCHQFPHGITDQVIQNEMPHIEAQQRAVAINRLLSMVELSMEDIETILNTLIYDGKVEMTIIAAKEGTVGSVDGHMKLYRAVNPILPPTGLVRAPCGLCPVFDDCHEGGKILATNLDLRLCIIVEDSLRTHLEEGGHKIEPRPSFSLPPLRAKLTEEQGLKFLTCSSLFLTQPYQ
ncbi:hypothetical protein A6R68_16754, partial [Neotoma lepida]